MKIKSDILLLMATVQGKLEKDTVGSIACCSNAGSATQVQVHE